MYSDFAAFYDALTADVDYGKRTEYLCELFRKFDRMPTLMLDLCCGTGGFSDEFAARGVSVIGVDLSPEMLMRAGENAERKGHDILYLCQDAKELDLYGTVDGAICCLDSLNHLTDFDGLCRAIARVSLFLEPGRLFIFDVNTVYKHETVLADHTFVTDDEDLYCVWSNDYDPATRTTEMVLDFFALQPDGSYARGGDVITERAYTPSEIETALQKAGLEILAVCGELTEEPPRADTERAVYVTRKASSWEN